MPCHSFFSAHLSLSGGILGSMVSPWVGRRVPGSWLLHIMACLTGPGFCVVIVMYLPKVASVALEKAGGSVTAVDTEGETQLVLGEKFPEAEGSLPWLSLGTFCVWKGTGERGWVT